MTSIDPHIFRAYDIRGKAHEQLSAEACRLIGQAYGSELIEHTGASSPRLCIGRDARTHGALLEAAVIDGLLSSGCTVLTIGEVPSPVNYFTICNEQLDGGVQVTASHNPGHDNGLKLSMAHANAFAGDDIQRLRVRIERGNVQHGKGKQKTLDAARAYAATLTALFANVGHNLAIAVDSGNGITGPLNCQILRSVGTTITELYTTPDGTFPNHLADPSKHDTLKELQATVKDHHLHVGIAFDGDGDRLGIVDETGTIRTADEMLLLLAKDHLSRFPGSPIVFTVSNSGILQSEITKWGGKPIMCKVGHSYVEHAMREHKALLGGEQSGHFFCCEDYYGFDDALVAALRVLSILQASGKPLSHLFNEFPKVHQAHELRPHVADSDKARIIDAVTKHFQKTNDVLTLDGARIDFGEEAWAGIRQSNTSPCISICMEARSEEKLKEVETMVLGHLRKYSEIRWDR